MRKGLALLRRLPREERVRLQISDVGLGVWVFLFGFRVKGLGLTVQGFGCRVYERSGEPSRLTRIEKLQQDVGCKVYGVGCRV